MYIKEKHGTFDFSAKLSLSRINDYSVNEAIIALTNFFIAATS